MKLLCFSQNLNYALGWMVVHSLWQALVIAILTGICLIVFQKKNAKLRYLIANFGLFAVFFAAVATFAIYYDFSKQPGETVFVPLTKGEVLNHFPSTNSNVSEVYQSQNYTNNAMSWEGFKTFCNRNMYLIVSIWFLGVMVFLIRLLGSISYVYYLRNRMNFPVDEYWQETLDKMREKVKIGKYIDFVESALVRSPIVVGHLKPMILFPIGAINHLNVNEVEAILAHELAHVMRHDYFFNIIQSVIEALFYFHPAVWWLSSQIRTERENCCDDIAISLCGNALTYAKSLVTVQEMAYVSPRLSMAFAGTDRKKQLLMRVQRVLNQPKSKINIMEKIVSTGIVIAFMACLAFGSNNNSTNDFPITNTIENQQVPNIQKVYLKYENNGELDSLPVDKQIADGNYNFVNNLYDVNLTVKNQHVIQFKINGLDVEGKDMPKFEKMINQLILSKKEEVPAPSQVSSVSTSSNYSFSEATTDDGVVNEFNFPNEYQGATTIKFLDDGSQMVLITKPGMIEPITINYEKNTGKIFQGGKPINTKELRKLGWKIEDDILRPIRGEKYPQNFSFTVPPTPPIPPTPPSNIEIRRALRNSLKVTFDRIGILKSEGVKAKELDNVQKQLAELDKKVGNSNFSNLEFENQLEDINSQIESIEDDYNEAQRDEDEARLDQEHAQRDEEQARRDEVQARKDEARARKDQRNNDDFDGWLADQLVKDGYVKKGSTNYSFFWNHYKMTVNGKEVSEANRKKYENKLNQVTGHVHGSGFEMTKNYKSKTSSSSSSN